MKNNLMNQYEKETSIPSLSEFSPSLKYVEWLESKVDKVENLLKALSEIEDLLTSDSNALENWQEEIQAVLDTKKELENK